MEIVQVTVVSAAVLGVAVCWVRWIKERIEHRRGRLPAPRNMWLISAPVALGSAAVGLVHWSPEAAGVFAVCVFALVPLGARIAMIVREIQRHRKVKPEDRQRRMDQRAARRRARAVAAERYGLELPATRSINRSGSS
jgi:hypothetical protein